MMISIWALMTGLVLLTLAMLVACLALSKALSTLEKLLGLPAPGSQETLNPTPPVQPPISTPPPASRELELPLRWEQRRQPQDPTHRQKLGLPERRRSGQDSTRS